MSITGARRITVVFSVLLVGVLIAAAAGAHSIDYIATDIQPQAIFSGQSGHFKLIDPISPGETITFNLTLELIESAGGATSLLPATITFGVKNTGGPAVPVVKFGTPSTTLSDTLTYTYAKVSRKIMSLMTPVTAYAPTIPGSYHFKIQAIDGFKGNGLTPGDGIVIHFTVSDAAPIATVLEVTLKSPIILYRAPENKLIATLTEKDTGAPVPNQPIDFYFNGDALGPVTTNSEGIATVDYDTSGLQVGSYVVAANFSEANGYAASSGSVTQCVVYKWLGFLPPVLVQSSATSGLGLGLFQGKVIPVKVKISDYYGAPVTDAQLRLYYARISAGAVEIDAVAIQKTPADKGNLMRYDADADQYILNWNISSLPNGDYNIRLDAEEGGCATPHWSPVRIGKATK